MRRRRSRGTWFRYLFVVLFGGFLGALVLSIVGRTRETKPLPSGDPAIQVEVLNGTGVEGVADVVATVLRRAGFQVESVGNADHFHYREDIVVMRTMPRARGESLARWLEDAPVIEQLVTDHPVDVTVVVGKLHSLVPETPQN